MISPLEYYQEQCKKGLIFEDAQQLPAMQGLQRVFDDLIKEQKKKAGIAALFHKSQAVKGLYLWGGVGIGKTFMMDCFYHCLPPKQKMRLHFYQFMQMVHRELTHHQGKKNPLDIIASDLAKQTKILCFDELFVSDITDAMLLGRLFKALFSRGVSLVMTSNVAPDDLYKNGLQREQFLQAIELIKEHTDVVHITTAIDYRLRHLKEAGVFYTPLDEAARKNMEKSFQLFANGRPVTEDPIIIHGRSVNIKKQAGDVVWFEFTDICTVPRSQMDYLAIAEKYRTVLISDVPAIPASAKDMICLFIGLVDVCYDARVRLVLSSAEPVAEIYSRGYMIMEYARTYSRLVEMQSTDYFSGE